MLGPVDWVVVLAWLASNLVVGFWFARRGGRSTDEFFAGGRALPWWAIGTSMVATTFGADTPLAVSGLAAKGVHTNWMWWNYGLSCALTVFLFSRLWRRAGVMTDVELAELRYGGGAGRFLRGLRAVWSGVAINLIVIAWGTRAMAKLLSIALALGPDDRVLGLPADVAIVLGLFLLTLVYTASAGLWGVVMTDVLQFVAAMAGAVLLGGLAWSATGGWDGFSAAVSARGGDAAAASAIVPATDDGWAVAKFAVLAGVLWWTSGNVDGGGALAQRTIAAKDERHAMWGFLWFAIAHICLRSWPWIVVGLAGIALVGPVDDVETYYPRLMAELLPPGLLGAMVGSFFAAYMSTISTQLNWGGALVINDLYRRFVVPGRADAHYLLAGRVAVVGLAVAGAILSFAVTDISTAWTVPLQATAGLGTVYLARWFWWRVNAWSEISALAVAVLCAITFAALSAHHPVNAESGAWTWLAAVPARLLAFPFSPALTALVSVPCWVAVTLATPPPDRAHLRAFYLRARPGGPGWRSVASDIEGFANDGPTRTTFAGIVGFAAAVFGVLVGLGDLLFERYAIAAVALTIGAVGAVVAARVVVIEGARGVNT